jgi:hypothetical protein
MQRIAFAPERRVFDRLRRRPNTRLELTGFRPQLSREPVRRRIN